MVEYLTTYPRTNLTRVKSTFRRSSLFIADGRIQQPDTLNVLHGIERVDFGWIFAGAGPDNNKVCVVDPGTTFPGVELGRTVAEVAPQDVQYNSIVYHKNLI
jgi:hypothetical protein